MNGSGEKVGGADAGVIGWGVTGANVGAYGPPMHGPVGLAMHAVSAGPCGDLFAGNGSLGFGGMDGSEGTFHVT